LAFLVASEEREDKTVVAVSTLAQNARDAEARVPTQQRTHQLRVFAIVALSEEVFSFCRMRESTAPARTEEYISRTIIMKHGEVD